VIRFVNIRNTDVEVVAEFYAASEAHRFQGQYVEDAELFTLLQGLTPFAGYLHGGSHAVSPVNDLYLSEFSLQYLGLF
jgi:hypothetical protein